MNEQMREKRGTPGGGRFAGHNRDESQAILAAEQTAAFRSLGEGLSSSTAGDADTFLSDTFAGRDVEVRRPVGVTATRAALKNSRGEADGAVRVVVITWDSVPAASDAGNFAVVGPKDGRPLVVHVHSGFPQLLIESGNVVVIAESGAGHSIKVGGSAHATILCGEGRKVSSRTSGGGTTDIYLDKTGWGSHSAEDGGTLTLHGTDRNGRDDDSARPGARAREHIEALMAAH